MYAGRSRSMAVEALFPPTGASLHRVSWPHPGPPPAKSVSDIEGSVPGLAGMPIGCPYQNRCPYAEPRCGWPPPPVVTIRRARGRVHPLRELPDTRLQPATHELAGPLLE